MFKSFLYLSAIISWAYGYGELYVLNHPNGIYFKDHEQLYESELTEVYSLALGFTIEKGSSWTGMYVKNPFNLAKAVVTVAVDGIPSLNVPGHNFPLKTDVDDDEVFYSMKRRIHDHNPSGENRIVDIDLSKGLREIDVDEFSQENNRIDNRQELYYLKYEIDVDRGFLHEIAALDAVADKVDAGALKKDSQPGYFRFKSRALHLLSDFHGENATATQEAKKVLVEAIDRLNRAFIKAYNGKVLVSVITSDVSHTRRIRSVTPEAKPKAIPANLNLAETYDENYPVIFNIILWFGIAMVFSLLAICIAIGTMDPGRDSIIYRMTSTRMKKDN